MEHVRTVSNETVKLQPKTLEEAYVKIIKPTLTYNSTTLDTQVAKQASVRRKTCSACHLCLTAFFYLCAFVCRLS